jgi:hypothetical protein
MTRAATAAAVVLLIAVMTLATSSAQSPNAFHVDTVPA